MAIAVSDSVPVTNDKFKDGLLQGGSWTFSGGPRVLSYSFNINFDFDQQGNVIPGHGGTWGSYPALAAAFTRALGAWSNVANIGFQNVPSGNYVFESTSDIAVGLTGDDLYSGLGALALGFFPDPRYVNQVLSASGYSRDTYPRPEGDILFDNYHPAFSNLGDGGMGYWTLVHEIGHALGLKHPGDDGGNARKTFAQLDMQAYDQERYTVMSYNGPESLSTGHSATPMPLDILAIQQIYGANMGFHAGNDSYVPAIDGAMRTIWDAGGTDMLDASSFAGGVTLNLHPGALMDLGSGTVLGIAYNCTIENATGGAGSDTLYGNDANNILRGQGGNNTLSGDGGNDSLEGGSGSNALDGGDGNDTLTGGSGDESLSGGGGNDVLSGGGGANSYYGGPGDDTFYISSAADMVQEHLGEGTDTVLASASFNGAGTESIEYITLTGTANIDASGGMGTIRINGNSGANVLAGAYGIGEPMTLAGGPGDDGYLVHSALVTVQESPGNGIDSITLDVAVSYTLPDNVERLTLTLPFPPGTTITLTGNALNNLITGAVGDSILDGGLGADTLLGGGGADTYIVDNPGDVVNETLDSARDLVASSVSFALPAAVEDLLLTGVAASSGSGNDLPNALTGNGAANQLSGGGGADTLSGAGGNDTLDGGPGLDLMRGGTGDDTYRVETAFHGSALALAGSANDYVTAGKSYFHAAPLASISPATVSDLTHDGLVDFVTINVTDSASNDWWFLTFSTYQLGQNLQSGTYANAQGDVYPQAGFAGFDVFGDGRGTGNGTASFTIDTISVDYTGATPLLTAFAASFTEFHGTSSLSGRISLNVDSGFAETIEEAAGEGVDTVLAQVDYTLPDNVENLTLAGTGALAGSGNALANQIGGNAGDNTLTGGGGNDIFVFAANGNGLDRITDLGPGDALRIGTAAFFGTTGSGDGTQLGANQVQLGYDANGALLYVGTDATSGADVTIRINGAPAGTDFKLLANQIMFELNNHAPSGSVLLGGSGTVGQALSASNSLDDLDGLGPVSYQWLADGKAIPGASGASYTPLQAQAGHAISVQASYIDGHGMAESVLSAPLLVPFEPRAVEILAYSWKAHTLLDRVDVSAAGLDGATETTDAAGTLHGIADLPTLVLNAQREPAGEAAATSAAVNVQDAIDILKMIVGLDVNGAGRPLSAYQALAADFDSNGVVGVSDAVAVLRYVVGLEAPQPAWHFANEADLGMPQRAGLNPGLAAAGIEAEIAVGDPVHIGLVGYLSGDVNASLQPPVGAQDLDITQPDYFQDLTQATGLPLWQFGVYAP